MEFRHNYIEVKRKRVDELKENIIGTANWWVEWYYEEIEAIKRKESDWFNWIEDNEDIEEALQEHKESPISEYEKGHTFDIDEAMQLLSYLEDESMYADISEYEKLERELREDENDLEKVIEIVEMIEKYLEIKSISTSRKSISTYVYFEMTKENYMKMVDDLCLDDNDYYDDLVENYDEIDEFINDYSHHDLCIRISDHEVGSRYDFFHGDISYSDESAKIYI